MIDDTDVKILDLLNDDGRASFSEIADELGLATSTVAGRVKKLESEGIITGFSPSIDYEKLGFELTAMVNIKAKSDKIEETARALEDNTRVISFFEVTGEKDMILVSRFLDREDINSFLKKLQKMEGIESTGTNVILTEPKLEDNMDLKDLMSENGKI